MASSQNECLSGNKRKRTNAMGAAAGSGLQDYKSMIADLPMHAVVNFLADAAQHHPDVAEKIVHAHRNISAGQEMVAGQAEAVHFNYYLQNIRTALRYSKTSGKPPPSAAFVIRVCSQAIVEDSGEHSTSYVKNLGLTTLLEIGDRVGCLSSALKTKMRAYVDVEDCLQSALLRIAKKLTVVERSELVREGFVKKLKSLDNLATSYFETGKI